MSGAPVVLCFFLREDPQGREVQTLLGLKKTGFGQGRVVAVGGHVEPGESAVEAAVRESAEEVGLLLSPETLSPLGRVRFRFPSHPEWDMDTDLFLSRRWQGEATESTELSPAWYPVTQLPYARMWPDARHWLGPALELAAAKIATEGPDQNAKDPIDVVIILAGDNESVAEVQWLAC